MGSLFALEDVKCSYEYSVERSSHVYHFRWNPHSVAGANWICIAMIDNCSGEVDQKYVCYTPSLNYSTGKYLNGFEIDAEMTAADHVIIKKFVVFGISGSKNFVYAEYEKLRDNSNITCQAICGSGIIRWKFINKKNSKLYELYLNSSIDLQEGVVFYSYFYSGIKFRIAIPDEIRRGNKRYPAIRIPDGATNLRLDAEGTSISVVEMEKGLWERLKELFRLE